MEILYHVCPSIRYDERILTIARRFNLGRGRKIPPQRGEKHRFHVHRSVKIRMDAEPHLIENSRGLKYKPKTKFDTEPIWVD